mmetsp:Transcript_1219/g.3196  ORF Transcript_1219/g.3196 Transcript_1219/m.3196 type:complete len:295 (+) Transcript_1219:746-1630(+)
MLARPARSAADERLPIRPAPAAARARPAPRGAVRVGGAAQPARARQGRARRTRRRHAAFSRAPAPARQGRGCGRGPKGRHPQGVARGRVPLHGGLLAGRPVRHVGAPRHGRDRQPHGRCARGRPARAPACREEASTVRARAAQPLVRDGQHHAAAVHACAVHAHRRLAHRVGPEHAHQLRAGLSAHRRRLQVCHQRDDPEATDAELGGLLLSERLCVSPAPHPQDHLHLRRLPHRRQRRDELRHRDRADCHDGAGGRVGAGALRRCARAVAALPARCRVPARPRAARPVPAARR